jgi:predicted nucleic acid-binding protein
MATYYLDTNIFLRMFVDDNHQMHQDCYQLLKSIDNGDLSGVTSTPVLAEIAWTLVSFYHQSRDDIVKHLRSVIETHHLSIIEDFDHPKALDYLETYHLKYVDCLIASSKHLQNKTWQLVSYDTDFDKIKGLKRLEPSQVIA